MSARQRGGHAGEESIARVQLTLCRQEQAQVCLLPTWVCKWQYRHAFGMHKDVCGHRPHASRGVLATPVWTACLRVWC